jgi:flagellar motor switch protein FliM
MLQQNDVDALLAALLASQQTTAASETRSVSEIKIYDFAKPDNLPSEFQRALENINATFARAIAGMLTGHLSAGVIVEPIAVDQLTYRQFCNSVPDSTAICTFSIPPLDATALFEINPHVAWYLIDRGLGGQGEVLENPREFTWVEKGLLDDLFRRILRELGKAWEVLCPLRPNLREILNNPTIARIAQPDDRMVVCSFNLVLPGTSGMSSYCIPVSSLEFERLLNKELTWDEGGDASLTRENERALHRNLLNAPVPVRACLPDQDMTLGELSGLKEGDVIHLDAWCSDPVEVRIANQLFYHGRPLTLKEQITVEIVDDVVEEF